MSVQIFRLLTSDISHDRLSDTTQKILGITNEQFSGDHPQVGPVVSRVRIDYAGLKQAMTRKSGSVHTMAIKSGYAQSFNSLVALRYLLRLRSKQTDTPEVVKLSQEVKTALVMRGVWRYKNLSHQHISSLIDNSIEVLSVPEIREKLTALGAIDAFNTLVAGRQRCAALEAQRIDEQAADTTPQIRSARGRLLRSINTLLSVVALGAETDPAGFAIAAERNDEVVKAANAVTRSAKTRRENAEADLAEATKNGQGSASAGGAAQNATNPLHGNPVTGVTQATNPVGPPECKGASTA
jgi:hypothetical protein